MENGSGMVDTNSLLLARGFGGYGVGFGGYGGGYGTFASPASNAVRINRTDQNVENQADCTRMAMGLGLDRISDQNQENRRIAQFDSIKEGQFQAELRNGDGLRDVERLIIDGQKEAAKCCCDAKLEACKNTNEILKAIADNKAEMLAVESRNIERALNAANAELTALKTQIACGCCPPCGR